MNACSSLPSTSHAGTALVAGATAHICTLQSPPPPRPRPHVKVHDALGVEEHQALGHIKRNLQGGAKGRDLRCCPALSLALAIAVPVPCSA